MFDNVNRRLITHIITGSLLIFLGLFFLLDNFNIIYMHNVWMFWPFIIVAFGIGRILSAQNVRDYIKAGWLIFIGLWLFASIQHIFGLTFHESWPLVLIAWGLTLVAREVLIPRQESNHGKGCCHGN
jgi:hypothetical protein